MKKAAKVIYLNKAELSKSIFQRINNKYSIIPNGIVLNNIDLEKSIDVAINYYVYFTNGYLWKRT